MYHTALEHTELSAIAEIFMYYWLEEHLQSLIWGSLIKNEKALQYSVLETSYKDLKKLWAYIHIISTVQVLSPWNSSARSLNIV